MRRLRFLPWVLLPALMTGCYGAKVLRQPVTVEESARDVEAMRQQQAALETRMAAMEKHFAEQAEILRAMKAESATSWGDLDTRLAVIDSKLRDALGQREGYARNPTFWSATPQGSLPRGGDSAEPPGNRTGADSTSRLAGADSAGAAVLPGTGAPGDSAAFPPRSEAENKRIYDQAYKDLTRGNYSLAVLGFQEYLHRSPSSDLSDNAQYWIGECFYAQRDFNQAAQEFLKVPDGFPKGDKVPAALLKTGYSFLQLDDRPSARRYLNQVIEQFPNSEEAVSARNKLRSAM